MKKSDLPEEFIQVYRLVGSFTMKTPELINFSTRLDDIMNDILRISNVMVHSIIVEIKKYVPLFYKLCEEIAHLDVLQSLAEASVPGGYIRPKFADFTEVTFAHHPLLDFLLPTKPISNPISCSSDFNVHIITGPNGSGKSIFIRQVLLLQVMAQVGCFVPAQTAVFRPADRMYARIYLEDNMEYGASSFILEMKEIKYIMTTMTENSLIIIDELCRSTSLEEGTALAIAIVEKMAQSAAYIYITTHFTLLTKLYDMYLNVKVWQLETIPSGEDPNTFKLDFKYSLVSGVTSVKRYGVYIVRNIWPESILKYVDELLDKITKKPSNPNFLPLDPKIRLKYNVESRFRKLKSQNKLTIAEVNKLQNEYQSDLEKLGYPTNAPPVSNLNWFTGNLPEIRHSVFDNTQNSQQENYIEKDLQSVDERMKQIFTPEPSVVSEATDLETEKRMQEVFTPEGSQRSQLTNYHEFVDDQFSDTSSYRNVSRFIREHSENIHKLVPEVNVSYREMSQENVVYSNNNETSFKFKKPSKVDEGQNKKEEISSINLSKDMNDFKFSVPLCSDLSKTSTPVPRRNINISEISSSPIVHVYKGMRCNFSTPNTHSESVKESDAARSILDFVDLESLREDLEVCSKVFAEDDDDFEESCKSFEKKDVDKESLQTQPATKISYPHIMPVVTIVEGPNNTTVSFDENDFSQDVGSANEIEEESKINISFKKNCYPHIMPVVKIIEGPNNTTISFDENDCTEDMDEFVNEIERGEKNKINIISNVLIAGGDKIVEECDNNEGAVEGNETDAHEDSWHSTPNKSREVEECFRNVPQTDSCVQNSEGVKNEATTLELEGTKSDCLSGNISRNLPDASFRSKETITNKTGGQMCEFFNYEKTLDQGNLQTKAVGAEWPNFDPIKSFEDGGMDKEMQLQESNTLQKPEEKSTPSANTIDKNATTSVSAASKLRKLDQTASDSSPLDGTRKTLDTNIDKSTSLSSASKKRNLDQTTNDSSPSELSASVCKRNSDDSGKKRKISTKSSSSGKSGKKKGVTLKRKFVPPWKLSAKEIRAEFREQDRILDEILESSPTSSNFSKYLEQRMNRPSIKQIQNTTHVALIRKTTEGLEVIPAEPPRMKRKTIPIKRNFSAENFSVSIFSDKNAKPFESYLNSSEKDYKTFSFNFSKNLEREKFKFAPKSQQMGEYTSNSVTRRFVRTATDTIWSQDSASRTLFRTNSDKSQVDVCLSQQTLTPDGFYKQNKTEITRILNKYLHSGTQDNQCSGSSAIKRSIFENKELNVSDLNL